MDNDTSGHVLATPIWVFAVRLVQVLGSLIVLGLSADIVHDLYLDELGLAIAVAVLTWFIVAYALTTEKIRAWQAGYHVVAVLALDAFMLVMWLASWAAVAAKRAQFRIPTSVSQCFDNGSLLNSKTCMRRRAVERRDLLFKKGEAEMSAAAGIGALVWLLFIATFVWTLVHFLRGRKEGRFPIGIASAAHAPPAADSYPMEPKVEQPGGQPTGQQHAGHTQPYPQTQTPYPQQQLEQQQQGPYAPAQVHPPPPPQAYSPPPPQAYSPPPPPQAYSPPPPPQAYSPPPPPPAQYAQYPQQYPGQALPLQSELAGHYTAAASVSPSPQGHHPQ